MAKGKPDWEDDGHTIADMNVEGMPWYDRSRRVKRRERNVGGSLSPTERRATMFAVVVSALLVAAAFGVVYFVVILLMDLAF